VCDGRAHRDAHGVTEIDARDITPYPYTLR